MPYSINRGGFIGLLPPHQAFRDEGGIFHPWNVIEVWSAEELAAIGVAKASESVSLDDLKSALKASVDLQAEAERAKYITLGAGQAMTYQAKAAEAQRYIESSGLGSFPLLEAEVGVTGETLADVAFVVLSMHGQWQTIGAQIERARLSAKAAINAAADEESARSVAPDWPSP